MRWAILPYALAGADKVNEFMPKNRFAREAPIAGFVACFRAP
jgi:hypothetical protein